MHSRIGAAALLLLGCLGGARAEGVETVTIPPLDVTKPSGEGWQVVRRSEQVIAFQRIDQVAKKQSTAYVALMALKSSGDLAGIEAELKQSIAAALPKLLAVHEVTYKGSQSRGYPCVTAVAETTQALVVPQSGETLNLPMSVIILACRLEGSVPMGFMAGYSRSAFSRDAQAQEDAETFFKGVTLSSGKTKVVAVEPMKPPGNYTGKGVLRTGSCPKPAYPPESLAAGRSGTGQIRVNMSAQARVLSSEVLVSSGTPELDEAARAVLPRCSYTPSFKDSNPVADTMVIEFVWALSPTPSVSFDSK
ncbi:energy transducer TonB [Roseateles sp. P5_E4]